MTLRLATWNINSVRLRLSLIARFVRRFSPDILCLQETKCPDESFPEDAFRKMGFSQILFHGQKSYHGVAILSRLPLASAPHHPFGGEPHARYLATRLGKGGGAKSVLLHNVYVPAGGDVPDAKENDKFAHKLRFLSDMASFFEKKRAARQILVGDFNVAPMEHDVWSHKQLLNVVSHTPIEVEHLARLRESCAWIDVARAQVPPHKKLYTWWSYRAQDWRASDRGRRLDHIWITPALKKAMGDFKVARAVRGWKMPSDHAPVLLDLQL